MLSSEFWAAVIGAVIGAATGGVVSAMVGQRAFYQQMRVADLVAVQKAMGEFIDWALLAYSTPASEDSKDLTRDAISERLPSMITSADGIFIRLNEEALRTAFFTVHELSTRLVRARAEKNEIKMTHDFQLILAGSRAVQAAASHLMQQPSFPRSWREFWGEGVRIPRSVLVEVERVIGRQEDIDFLMMRGLQGIQNPIVKERALECSMALAALEREYRIRAGQTLEAQAKRRGRRPLWTYITRRRR